MLAPDTAAGTLQPQGMVCDAPARVQTELRGALGGMEVKAAELLWTAPPTVTSDMGLDS